jgi:microcystin degradation protein MlrC
LVVVVSVFLITVKKARCGCVISIRQGKQRMSNRVPKIALLGLILESNRFSRPATYEDFRLLTVKRDQELLEDARSHTPSIAIEFSSFVKAMDATGDWQPVPILLMASRPLGLIQKDAFEAFCNEAISQLDDSFDAVYLCQHGAMAAEHLHDPDGFIAEQTRDKVGAGIPIVMTLDLHANISDKMCDNVDLICGYRTNPHVDQYDRGQEAAFVLRQILSGLATPKIAHVKLPLAPSSITLLTGNGPLGRAIDLGQRRLAEYGGRILNVSVFGNFIFSDVPENGISIVVTARDKQDIADDLANELAEFIWGCREEFIKTLTPIDKAIGIVLDDKRSPVILSDSGDNPGGGGSGRTTNFLSKLVSIGARNVLYGSFFDPALAKDAHQAGLGNTFEAAFNQDNSNQPWEKWDEKLSVVAKVVGLHNGEVIGTLGIMAGRRLSLGPCALLEIQGVRVVIISERSQTADPVFFEMFGEDIANAHTVVVKSRGHFRAGFKTWFDDSDTYEVDTVGLTSPVLSRWDFKNVPRPSFPFQRDAIWSPGLKG